MPTVSGPGETTRSIFNGRMDNCFPPTIHAGENAVSGKVPVVYGNVTSEVTLKPGETVTLSRQDFVIAK